MKEQSTFKSFAKINLYLKVLGKRPDGYHDIESLFQTVSLHDVLKVSLSKTDSDKVRFHNFEIDRKQNTVLKAISLLREFLKFKGRVIEPLAVDVEKNIPPGSGLGGGSSNAAALLKCLNFSFNLGLETKDLLTLAEKIGSDVPFFIYGGLCLVKGKGEIVQPLDIDFQTEIVLVFPGVSISTSWAYEELDRVEFASSSESAERAIQQILQGDFRKESLFYNSFEKIVLNRFLEVRKAYKQLEKLDLEPALSGSGSTVYAVLKEGCEKEKIDFELKRKGFNIFFAKTVNPGAMETC